MLERCNDCLNPKLESEPVAKTLAEMNEEDRKRVVDDLEKAGVTFPLTELETVFGPSHSDDRTVSTARSDDGQGLDPEGGRLAPGTKCDYATTMPDDLKHMLRRQYYAEAQGNMAQKQDEENQASISNTRVPRVPFWFLRRTSVATVETKKDVDVQQADRSTPPTDSSKKQTSRIRLAMLFCCLLVLALIAILVMYFAVDFNDGSNKALDSNTTIPLNNTNSTGATEEPVGGATSVPDDSTLPPEDCTSSLYVNENCYVKGEQIVVGFTNCNPEPDDWLGLFDADTVLNSTTTIGDEYEDWQYTCGNKQCRGVVHSSLLTFRTFRPGTYSIYLLRNDGEPPYDFHAVSETFVVQQNALDCP